MLETGKDQFGKDLAVNSQVSAQAWHTGLSGGAPDSVWCARLVNGKVAGLENRQSCTAIIHRTVWWCTGLSGEPTAASATVGHAIRARRVAHANGRLGAPDSVRCANQPEDPTVGCAKNGRRSAPDCLQ